MIREEHLQAALALWAYADTSAKLVFGAEPGDPLPGLVLDKLRQAPKGLTRSERQAGSRDVSRRT